jgi:hypothetical protein
MSSHTYMPCVAVMVMLYIRVLHRVISRLVPFRVCIVLARQDIALGDRAGRNGRAGLGAVSSVELPRARGRGEMRLTLCTSRCRSLRRVWVAGVSGVHAHPPFTEPIRSGSGSSRG